MAKKVKPEIEPEYGADQIRLLEGLEAVRVRPGMYIGSTDSRGLHHLIWEITDNAVDEALAGRCTEIIVEVDDKNVLTVIDNGRGIPVGINKKTGRSALDLVFTELHAGGKFGDGGYKVSGGLHGVGASVTNALSEWLQADVKVEGFLWTTKFKRGKTVQKVTKGRALKKNEGTGTTVSWLFDREIFKNVEGYSHALIEQRLREKSYLVRGLRFVLRMPGRDEQVFVSKNGISDYIKELAAERKPVHREVIFMAADDITVPGEDGKETTLPVEIAMQWTNADDERIYAFTNIVSNPDGGTHVTGFKTAVTKALNNFAREQGKFKKDSESFEGRDIMEGIVAAVSVKVENPQFEGQTKGKLNNPEAKTAVQTFVYSAFSDWLADPRNAKESKLVLERCLLARDIRLAKGKVSKKLKDEATSIFTDTNLPGKLKDCGESSIPIEERELFIVEGDSAMGTAKDARDSKFQAILPIRGKILNVLDASGGKAFDNAEVEGILTALGGRKDAIGKRIVATLEAEQRRYGKVVILTDADTDGAHIAMLLMTMFYELFPKMLTEGRIFLAQPPLYKINLDNTGSKYIYAYDDEEREKLMKKHNRSGEHVSRFKGLGEMNAPDLAETCFDLDSRSLLQVQIADAAEAQDVVSMLMGKGKAELRREWLEEVGLETEAI